MSEFEGASLLIRGTNPPSFAHVSEQTITALAGHVSKRMLERYSHIRAQAKRDAIETLESKGFTDAEAQKWAQSAQTEATVIVEQPEKVLN